MPKKIDIKNTYIEYRDKPKNIGFVKADNNNIGKYPQNLIPFNKLLSMSLEEAGTNLDELGSLSDITHEDYSIDYSVENNRVYNNDKTVYGLLKIRGRKLPDNFDHFELYVPTSSSGTTHDIDTATNVIVFNGVEVGVNNDLLTDAGPLASFTRYVFDPGSVFTIGIEFDTTATSTGSSLNITSILRALDVNGDSIGLDDISINTALSIVNDISLSITDNSNSFIKAPSFTTTEISSVTLGASDAGKIVYDSVLGQFQGWDGSAWIVF